MADKDPDPDERQHGYDLLSRISNEMVRAQKQYFGRGPTSAKSYLLDDFLLVVMRGSQTQAEKSMLEFGHEDRVRDFRQQFENEMTTRLSATIEELTGRKVLGYQSQILFEPEVVVELFFFDRAVEESEVRVTAEGQLQDPRLGEAETDAQGEDVAEETTPD